MMMMGVVSIRGLDGRCNQVEVEEGDTVASLKAKIASHTSTAFHLFLRGSKLSHDTTIKSLSLQEGDFLVLIPYTTKKKQAVSHSASSSTAELQSYEMLSTKDCSGKGENSVVNCNDGELNPKLDKADHPDCKQKTNPADDVWNAVAADLAIWRSSLGTLDDDNTLFNFGEERRELQDFGTTSEEASCSNIGSPLSHKKWIRSSESVMEQPSKRLKKSWSCPPPLERLHQIFVGMNLVYGFLQKQHMQGTWQNMKGALQQLSLNGDEKVSPRDIETLAEVFPKLVQVSQHVGEGDDMSFNIDLFDPSKIPYDAFPRSLHDVMPPQLQHGIGPSDDLPSAGSKKVSDRVIRSAVQKRELAFQTEVSNLYSLLKQSENTIRGEDLSLESLLSTLKSLSYMRGKGHWNSVSATGLPRPPRLHKKLVRCMDTKDLAALEMIDHLKHGLGSLGQLVHCEKLKAREAKFCELLLPLSAPTQAAMKRLGISKLYTHQTEVIEAAVSGMNVIVATSTASGKSVCYNIPVLEELFSNSNSCALYLFPTKALAQDQLRALLEMTRGLQPALNMGVYDGDTLQHHRLELRDNARLLITNPDMLHMSILPSHAQFDRFLSNLRYVVVDEAHAYRGAFGCHSAMIFRRLRRLCHHVYGVNLTFVVSSATVANPREHAVELLGVRDIKVVQEDGSPCGEKLFLLWNPPLYFVSMPALSKKKNKVLGGKSLPSGTKGLQTHSRRSSPIVEIASLLAEMVQHNLRCISFCKTRKLSELVLNYTRENLKETSPDLINTICAYRAGYTAQVRREIESNLFSGRLRAVAATNALELGVDIGSLDATLHLGFPGTIASLWQQAGRAGRREKPSLSIYVAFESPLDQFFMKNPQKLFAKPIEHAQIDACNPQVLKLHLACAAVEHPLHLQYDEEFFGSGLKVSIMELLKEGCLARHPSRCSKDESWDYIGAEKSPSQSVSIRAIDPEKYTIINQTTNQVIEEVEEGKAFFEVYEGAVYIHQGKTYLVKKLDLAAKIALCDEADLKYYTKTRDFTDIHVIGGELAYPRKVSEHEYPATTAQANMCKITTRWIGFRRIWHGTNVTFDSVDLFLPEYSYESQATWIRVPHQIREQLEEKGISFRAGLHAASHAILNIMPMYIMCNTSDVGTECANPHDTRYFPERLLIFDRHPGGIGIAVQARPLFGELLQAALEILKFCDCTADAGCPNCIQTLACGEYNEVIHKEAAILILQGVIEAENVYRQKKDRSDNCVGNAQV